MTMLVILGALLVLAAAAPLAAHRFGRDTGFALAAGFAVATGAVVWHAPEVVAGGALRAALVWIPQAGLTVSVLLDGLALLFVLLVLAVGAVVMAYAARYLPAGRRHGRLLGWLTLFAAAMLGLVVADDLILLVVCWELTSISSFMLIAGRGQHRVPATRAFVTTTAGGLALLAAVAVINGTTGMTRLSQVLAAPEVLRDGAAAPAVIVLLIIAAATKSAQVPFHFWLPGAMVAPTPVSTYLHAATMVKAGIYLLLRFTPVFGGVGLWRTTLLALGLATALWGALLALKRHDLKAILAYSTISQLGLLVALTGVGTPAATTAVALLLLAHAAYKATLFMVAGIVDHEAGTRDIRELDGLGRRMPLTAGVAGLAALSMAGVPPLLGFVAKEEALGAAVDLPGPPVVRVAVLSAVVVASALTVAYSARLFHGAFAGATAASRPRPRWSFVAPPAVTTAAGLIAGGAVTLLEPLVDGVVVALHGAPGDGYLALWHGWTPELALSAAIIAAGVTTFAARDRVGRLLARDLPAAVHGVATYDRVQAALLSAGRMVARSAAAPGPTTYIGAALITLLLGASAYAAHAMPAPAAANPTARPTDWMLVALIGGVLVLLVRTRDRLTAAVLLGIVGYLVALWFATLGAADLALTLLLVETLFVAAIVMSLRTLRTPLLRQRPHRSLPVAALAALTGIVAGSATWALTGRRPLSDAGGYFLDNAEEAAGGTNVVNTILVDFRALDTLGEAVVVVVAIVGLSVVAGWRRGTERT